jgi:hypothetical protein
MRRLRHRPDAAASGETVDRTNGQGTGEIVAREWTARKQPEGVGKPRIVLMQLARDTH